MGILAAVSFVGLWVVYGGLSPGGSSSGVQASFEGLIDGGAEGSILVKLVGALPLPLEVSAGFACLLDLTSGARPSSLLGRSWDGRRGGSSRWHGDQGAARHHVRDRGRVVGGGPSRHDRRNLVRFVVLPGLMLWLFLVAQPLNLGLRLAMPSLAFAFIGLSALRLVGEDLPRRHRVGLAAIGAIVLVGLVSTVVAAPPGLAWTPAPFTPPTGG
ncbi:MAG: hypothetical protein R2711_07610 [Acidimicrobiales bacterium]